ncbi:MAG: prepilin-type N-terminal cleavage/methylation domain-containing protein [candidate division Zixibacteria bacterium]|nr:prepilin-type N-terminal cleavage/methylation domain-containing protein [candidate division Zixibacteria bacterium]
MKIRHLKIQDGFTLLEVLISMVILGIAILVLLNMAMVAVTGNDWSNQATTATQAIQQKMEQLRSTANPVSGMETVDGVNLYWTISKPQNHLRKVYLSAMWEDMTSEYKYTNVTAFIKTDSI